MFVLWGYEPGNMNFEHFIRVTAGAMLKCLINKLIDKCNNAIANP